MLSSGAAMDWGSPSVRDGVQVILRRGVVVRELAPHEFSRLRTLEAFQLPAAILMFGAALGFHFCRTPRGEDQSDPN